MDNPLIGVSTAIISDMILETTAELLHTNSYKDFQELQYNLSILNRELLRREVMAKVRGKQKIRITSDYFKLVAISETE